MKRIYLDYAASTPVDKSVLKAMAPYFSERFGNAGSLHFFGQEAMAAIDGARQAIARLLEAEFGEIFFTGSATEANNLALRGVLGAARIIPRGTGRRDAPAASRGLDSRRVRSAGDQAERASETFRSKQSGPLNVIVSSIEHESILETAQDLQKEGIEVVYLPANREGFVDLEKLKAALNERTVLVSVMYANNEIGTIQPIKEVVGIIENWKLKIGNSSGYPLVHTDAVQAFQFLDCNVNALGVDLMTLSAHKIYGPKGVGCLYVRGGAKNLKPLTTGGGQESGLRSGTENVPNIVGFGRAAELVAKNRDKEAKRIGEIKVYFWGGLKRIYPSVQANPDEAALYLNIGQQKIRATGIAKRKRTALERRQFLPNILNVYFPGQKSEDLLIKLDQRGVAVSSGSACSVRSSKPSHVLRALRLSPQRIQSSLRFSFGRFTTKAEIESALKVLGRLTK